MKSGSDEIVGQFVSGVFCERDTRKAQISCLLFETPVLWPPVTCDHEDLVHEYVKQEKEEFVVFVSDIPSGEEDLLVVICFHKIDLSRVSMQSSAGAR